MVSRIGTSRTKSRHKFSKHFNEKGKLYITKHIQEFNAGDRVVLKADPSHHKGIYHSRFHGRIATVKGKRGKCYEVSFMDGSKEKTLIVAPCHLKKHASAGKA